MVEKSFLVPRANLRRAGPIMLHFDDSPDRGPARGKKNIGRRPCVLEGLRRRSDTRHKRSSRSAHDGNGHHRKDGPPVAPARDLNQIVAPHQPYEASRRESLQKRLERICRVDRAEFVLDVRDNDTPMLHQFKRHGEALFRVLHDILRFQRVLGAYEPPYVVQSECS